MQPVSFAASEGIAFFLKKFFVLLKNIKSCFYKRFYQTTTKKGIGGIPRSYFSLSYTIVRRAS